MAQHKLHEIWKDGIKWKVQAPKGILTFQTKNEALAWVATLNTAAENTPGHRTPEGPWICEACGETTEISWYREDECETVCEGCYIEWLGERHNANMAEHTPGPWEIWIKRVDDDHNAYFVKARTETLLRHFDLGYDREKEEQANARLIAAAPDLLALVAELAEVGKRILDPKHQGRVGYKEKKVAKRAIDLIAATKEA